ncbi:MAG TPA: molybdenum cofactor biosynthesis protein MoaE [Candidatus Methanofastidiosa archaeon]|nr:molybdenum cofactor biosynthesis protein MoaE [Candidatus Methanofastidiosa archaeon]HPR41432.1 molybdenum cofactor biosynthesis protein MoaE [Candidatus Methanofastidiosa archaeon]
MIKVQREDFDIEANIDSISDSSCGAVVSFIGTVKSPVKGGNVTALELEAYGEMAVRELEKIEVEARQRFAIRDLLVIHRIGRLEVGDRIVHICVSSEGRDAAFDASRFVLEKIKECVPLFKKEHTDKGEYWHG